MVWHALIQLAADTADAARTQHCTETRVTHIAGAGSGRVTGTNGRADADEAKTEDRSVGIVHESCPEHIPLAGVSKTA